jgi:hypothetical protein
MLFLFSAAGLSRKYGQRLLLGFVSVEYSINFTTGFDNSTHQIFTLPNVAGTIVFLSVPTTQHTKVGLLLAF